MPPGERPIGLTCNPIVLHSWTKAGGTVMPSPYEENALKEIAAWKHPALGWLGTAMRAVNWPLDKVGDAVMKTPGVGWVLEKSIGGLMNVTNDAARWSVPTGRDLRGVPKGRPCRARTRGPADARPGAGRPHDRLARRQVQGRGSHEGAAFGGMGLPGIPPDIVALVVLNLRAIAEYATYCGFDVSTQQESLFALNVLGFASSPGDPAKVLAMAQLVRIAQDVAKKRAWKELEKHAFVRIVQQIAKTLGIRLTKAKLGQFVPYGGALVGGGFNVYFTEQGLRRSLFPLPERFLAAKYGPDLLSVAYVTRRRPRPPVSRGSRGIAARPHAAGRRPRVNHRSPLAVPPASDTGGLDIRAERSSKRQARPCGADR